MNSVCVVNVILRWRNYEKIDKRRFGCMSAAAWNSGD